MTDESFPVRAPGHVLVVDDSPESRRLAQLQLEMIGWEVTAVSSAAAALEHLARSIPDAVISDIRMPKMSGDELARRIRETLGTQVRLVGYTAHCMEDELKKIREAGFDDVLIKPASMELLQKALPPPADAAG